MDWQGPGSHVGASCIMNDSVNVFECLQAHSNSFYVRLSCKYIDLISLMRTRILVTMMKRMMTSVWRRQRGVRTEACLLQRNRCKHKIAFVCCSAPSFRGREVV